MTEQDLPDLIRRAAEGDREAANELARRYETPVRMRLHRRLGDDVKARLDTEDLMQSTIMVALRDLPNFEYQGERAFVGWLSAIAARQVLMKGRHARAGKRDVKKQRPMDAAGGQAGAFTSPTQAAVRGELKTNVREALAKLGDAERRVIELHSIQGLGFAEVAEELGLSGKSAAFRLFQRAIKQMSSFLDAGAEEP